MIIIMMMMMMMILIIMMIIIIIMIITIIIITIIISFELLRFPLVFPRFSSACYGHVMVMLWCNNIITIL